jgi:hypothetical protein
MSILSYPSRTRRRIAPLRTKALLRKSLLPSKKPASQKRWLDSNPMITLINTSMKKI